MEFSPTIFQPYALRFTRLVHEVPSTAAIMVEGAVNFKLNGFEVCHSNRFVPRKF